MAISRQHCRRAARLATLTAALWLEAGAAAAQPQSGSALPAGSMFQVVIGLALVLALVGGCAWVLKRFSSLPGMRSGLLRILGGIAVGQRERIVLVEVGDTWLVVGVAPGQVRTLHSMPREASLATSAADALPGGFNESSFAGWLRRTLEKNKNA